MAGRVDELDLDAADGDPVAAVVVDQRLVGHPGHGADVLGLGSLHVDRHVDPLEQLGHPLQPQTHHRPADVVRMEVGGEHPRAPHPVGGQHVEKALDVVRRIDQHRLPRGPVADRVDEVDHLLRHHVGRREVATRQELAEVETVDVVHGLLLMTSM